MAANARTKRDPTRPTEALWNFYENVKFKNGLPNKVRLAVRLERTSQDNFGMAVRISAKVSGIVFASERMMQLNQQAADDLVIFNPSVPIMNEPSPHSFLWEISSDRLDDVDLDALVALEHTEFQSRVEVEKAVKKEIEARAAVEARLDAAAEPKRPEPSPSPSPHPEHGPKGDGIFALIWGNATSEGPFPTVVPGPAGDELRKDVENFKDIPAKPWRRKLDNELLLAYFPWLNPENVVEDNFKYGGRPGRRRMCRFVSNRA